MPRVLRNRDHVLINVFCVVSLTVSSVSENGDFFRNDWSRDDQLFTSGKCKGTTNLSVPGPSSEEPVAEIDQLKKRTEPH